MHVVARLGGDEFLVLLPGVTPAGAGAAAARARAALREPFLVDGLPLDVDAGIGVAVSGAASTDIHTLLRQADVAMYAAERRRTGVEFHDASDTDDRRIPAPR